MLQSEGSAQVLALSNQFGVSTQTIRKDLAFLEEHGVSVRCYGGAVAAGVIGIADEDPVDAKRGLHIPEKERIGRLAASMVKPGDAIILDSGTTTAQIARFLPEKGDIIVLTNDAGILNHLIASASGVPRFLNIYSFWGMVWVQSLEMTPLAYLLMSAALQ